jgi:hypothetical protein
LTPQDFVDSSFPLQQLLDWIYQLKRKNEFPESSNVKFSKIVWDEPPKLPVSQIEKTQSAGTKYISKKFGSQVIKEELYCPVKN